MFKTKYFNCFVISLLCLLTWECSSQSNHPTRITTGAEQLELYLPKLQGKSVGLLVNHTSIISQTHLIDTLLAYNVSVKTIFAPEHGFRGNLANGEKVHDGIDLKTGLPIISLYGKNKKPKPDQLENIDIVIYDIQDAGARFYTYISSMHYMMEACAEFGIEFLLLDRPNPNAHYVDGPVLEKQHTSFVGVHPIPIVYGMSTGELANMIKGEKWINKADSLELTVISLLNWTHDTRYSLPITPSPNLPNDQSVALYPSLCLFEGTNISMARGTDFPFQAIGFPEINFGPFEFTPQSIPAISKYPKHEKKVCYGYDLRKVDPPNQIDLSFLIKFYKLSPDKNKYFNDFFTNLSGTKTLRKQIEDGMSEEDIRASWQPRLDAFNKLRRKYLIYE